MVEKRGRVVQDVAVELAKRDNELGRVAERVVDGDEVGSQEGARAPKYLQQGSVRDTAHDDQPLSLASTYSSDGLHAEHKGVLGQVAGVAQRVLFPQLAKQVVHAAHVAEVVGKVALEERVDASAQDKPHDGGQVPGAGIGP